MGTKFLLLLSLEVKYITWPMLSHINLVYIRLNDKWKTMAHIMWEFWVHNHAFHLDKCIDCFSTHDECHICGIHMSIHLVYLTYLSFQEAWWSQQTCCPSQTLQIYALHKTQEMYVWSNFNGTPMQRVSPHTSKMYLWFKIELVWPMFNHF